MAPTPLTERIRDRLLALLADDRPDALNLSARLRELGSLGGVPVFSAALAQLAPLDLPEEEAQRVFAGLLQHRSDMERALRRDPGIRVAALDFLANVERRLTNPEIVECSLVGATERSAVTDPLTGLHSRRFFGAAIEREVRRGRRYRLSFSVILLDLDQYPEVNDTYGHFFGDVVLELAARIVRQSIREADLGCRFGEEAFAVILPQTPRTGAAEVAERIRASVEASFASRPIRGHELRLTVSGGIGCHPEDAQTPHTLIARADAALALAKHGGRNRIAWRHDGSRP